MNFSLRRVFQPSLFQPCERDEKVKSGMAPMQSADAPFRRVTGKAHGRIK
jgi:hypothetical protein